MSPPRKRPRKETIHVEPAGDRVLVDPSDQSAYKHFKRWAYRNLPERGMFWDDTAKLYVIQVDKTLQGDDVFSALRRSFEVLEYLPVDD